MTAPLRKSFVTAFACTLLIPFAAFAQADSQAAPQYSRTQLKQLIREAHTPDQYRALAVYYRSQEQIFHQKAVAEQKEWEQRVGGYKVDPARNQYDSYVEKAREMGARAADYERRSQ